jgi:hypothetical protein
VTPKNGLSNVLSPQRSGKEICIHHVMGGQKYRIDLYNIYEKFYDIFPNNFLMDNCSIFHPTICAKEMEDENA